MTKKRYKKNIWRTFGVCLLLVCTIIILTTEHTYAQKKVTVTEEKIEATCNDLPLNQRTRITVARFNVTTPSATREFGANMATMLSNALQETGCFNVLSRLANQDDLEDELAFSKSKHADQSKSLTDGKMLSAQLVITGEVTEYNNNSKNVAVGLVKVGKGTLKLGFIIQIKNPETREIYFSKSFNVIGKASTNTEVGISFVRFGGVSSSNPAEANALEQGIVVAMDYITGKRDALADNLKP